MRVTATPCFAQLLGAGDAGEAGADDDRMGPRLSVVSRRHGRGRTARRLAGRLGERGDVAAGEEPLVAVAPLDVLGDQQRVGRALGEDLLEVRLVLALADDVGEERRCPSRRAGARRSRRSSRRRRGRRSRRRPCGACAARSCGRSPRSASAASSNEFTNDGVLLAVNTRAGDFLSSSTFGFRVTLVDEFISVML